ncbi:MAG TPA: hypothetical protein VGX78_18235 [Pirellulales bacterium]|nr:hypothetical protein [Pirellulales bacterium]
MQHFSLFAELIDEGVADAALTVLTLDHQLDLRRNDLPICNIFVPNFAAVYAPVATHRRRLYAARLALAVCRYRTEHGRTPDSLSDAVSALDGLSAKPTFDREPSYESTADGFAVFFDEVAGQRHGAFTVKFVDAVETTTTNKPD